MCLEVKCYDYLESEGISLNLACRTSLRTLFLAVVLAAAGCEDKAAEYDSGHSDGYAVGYNTACQIRRTLIEENWSSESYSKGYSVGMVAGINACNARNSN